MINWITSLACTDDEQIDTDTDIDENGDEVEDQGKLVTSFEITDTSQNLVFFAKLIIFSVQRFARYFTFPFFPRVGEISRKLSSWKFFFPGKNQNSIIVNCVYSVDDYYIDFNNAPPTKIIQPGGSEFYLDLCGQENKCASGALCEKKSGLHTEWEPIGDINQVTVEKDLQLTSAIKFEIKIKQADSVSDKCPNGKV